MALFLCNDIICIPRKLRNLSFAGGDSGNKEKPVYLLYSGYLPRKFTGNQVAIVKIANPGIVSDNEIQSRMNFGLAKRHLSCQINKKMGKLYSDLYSQPRGRNSGHPILGAAFIINQMIRKNIPSGQILINLKQAIIPVDIISNNNQSRASGWSKCPQPFLPSHI